MKPDFNLNDPRFTAVYNILNARAMTAQRAAMALDHAVHPVYALSEGSTVPKQIGSCVVLEIRGQFFLLSAAHVYEPIGDYVVLVGCGSKLHPLSGDRFSSKQGPSGTHQDDKVDAAVLHITCPVPHELRVIALTLEHLDATPSVDYPEFYVAAGYRASRSISTNSRLESALDRYPSIEHFQAIYQKLDVDREKHVALAYEKHVLVNGKWQLSPSKLHGMSGGAIFRICGLCPDPRVPPPELATPRLSAIIIEKSKQKRRIDPLAIIGVRVGFHLGLIQRYLPDLFSSTG